MFGHEIRFLCGLLLLISTVGCSTIGASGRRPSKQVSGASPSETVKIFWEAATAGDEETVRQLAARTPNSFFKRCEPDEITVADGSKGKQSNRNPGTITLYDPLPPPATGPESRANPDDKFVNAPDPDLKFGLIYPTARFLYVSKIPLGRVTYINETVFENEAKVDVEFLAGGSYKIRETYFLVNDGSWKIFMSVEPDSVLITNKHYANSRPPCR